MKWLYCTILTLKIMFRPVLRLVYCKLPKNCQKLPNFIPNLKNIPYFPGFQTKKMQNFRPKKCLTPHHFSPESPSPRWSTAIPEFYFLPDLGNSQGSGGIPVRFQEFNQPECQVEGCDQKTIGTPESKQKF